MLHSLGLLVMYDVPVSFYKHANVHDSCTCRNHGFYVYLYTYMYMHGFLQDFKLEEDFERDNPGLTEALHFGWEYMPLWCITQNSTFSSQH